MTAMENSMSNKLNKSEKKRLTNLATQFYNEWEYYSNEFNMSDLDVSRRGQYVDEEERSCLMWKLTDDVKISGTTYTHNILKLRLVHPNESKHEIVFEIHLESTVTTSENPFREKSTSRGYTRTIVPTENMSVSSLMTMLLLGLSGIVGKNKLDDTVSSTIVSIVDSIACGELVKDRTILSTKQNSKSVIHITL